MFIFTPPSLPGDKRSAVNKRTIVIETRMPAMETEYDKLWGFPRRVFTLLELSSLRVLLCTSDMVVEYGT